jgi:hypothetical protein
MHAARPLFSLQRIDFSVMGGRPAFFVSYGVTVRFVEAFTELDPCAKLTVMVV